MLTKPEFGWSCFKLDGSKKYSLSYLDDIPFEWLEQAIHGLETLSPFCVKAFLEPRRFLCAVSYWNCHVIIEDEWRYPLNSEKVAYEISHTSMLEFCKYLYEDISASFEEWAVFAVFDYDDCDIEERKTALREKLDKLNTLISENEKYFGENRCFL